MTKRAGLTVGEPLPPLAFVLALEDAAGPAEPRPAVARLKLAMKTLLRGYGLRVRACRPERPPPPNPGGWVGPHGDSI